MDAITPDTWYWAWSGSCYTILVLPFSIACSNNSFYFSLDSMGKGMFSEWPLGQLHGACLQAQVIQALSELGRSIAQQYSSQVSITLCSLSGHQGWNWWQWSEVKCTLLMGSSLASVGTTTIITLCTVAVYSCEHTAMCTTAQDMLHWFHVYSRV